MSENKRPERLVYIKNESGDRIGCIAYSVHKDDKVIYYGYSICHEIDGFSKELARKIATGRLKKKPTAFEYTDKHITGILNDMLCNTTLMRLDEIKTALNNMLLEFNKPLKSL